MTRQKKLIFGWLTSVLLVIALPWGHVTALSLGNVGDDGFVLECTPGCWEVASGFDLNGDGLDDMLIGAPDFFEVGKAYVVFGHSDGGGVFELPPAPIDGFIIKGVSEGDFTGGSVSSAGDFNGDGFEDILVGAMGSDVSAEDAGAAYVIFGRQDPQDVNLSALGGAGVEIRGARSLNQAGYDAAAVGDFDGDGFDDVVVSSTIGIAYVIRGSANPAEVVELFTLSSAQGTKIVGFDHDTWLRVAGGGDINGDGIDDLLLADINWQEPFATSAGMVVVVFGRADRTQSIDVTALGEGGVTLVGGYDDQLGRGLSTAGDFNGDGYADVLMGAPDTGAPLYWYKPGNGYVLLGGAHEGLIRVREGFEGLVKLTGHAAADATGGTVADVGDFNGDGFGDVLVGAYLADDESIDVGKVYAVYGQAEPSDEIVLAGVVPEEGSSWEGPEEGYRAGIGLASGDINGDGLTDVIVKAVVTGPSRIHVVFNQSTAPDTATYQSRAAPGDAPRRHGSPSRVSMDFVDGDDGFGGPSQQTTTLIRDAALVSGFGPGQAANIIWHLGSNRVGWSTVDLVFNYTGQEVQGLNESLLQLHQAAHPEGPWTPSAFSIDSAANQVSTTATALGYFALIDPDALFASGFDR